MCPARLSALPPNSNTTQTQHLCVQRGARGIARAGLHLHVDLCYDATYFVFQSSVWAKTGLTLCIMNKAVFIMYWWTELGIHNYQLAPVHCWALLDSLAFIKSPFTHKNLATFTQSNHWSAIILLLLHSLLVALLTLSGKAEPILWVSWPFGQLNRCLCLIYCTNFSLYA